MALSAHVSCWHRNLYTHFPSLFESCLVPSVLPRLCLVFAAPSLSDGKPAHLRNLIAEGPLPHSCAVKAAAPHGSHACPRAVAKLMG